MHLDGHALERKASTPWSSLYSMGIPRECFHAVYEGTYTRESLFTEHPEVQHPMHVWILPLSARTPSTLTFFHLRPSLWQGEIPMAEKFLECFDDYSSLFQPLLMRILSQCVREVFR